MWLPPALPMKESFLPFMPALKATGSRAAPACRWSFIAAGDRIGWLLCAGSRGLAMKDQRQAAGAGAKKPSDAIAGGEGVWQGALEGNGMRLRLQLHVSHDEQKKLVAALDSPDQGVSGLPAINVSQKDAAFHFEIPVVSGIY